MHLEVTRIWYFKATTEELWVASATTAPAFGAAGAYYLGIAIK